MAPDESIIDKCGSTVCFLSVFYLLLKLFVVLRGTELGRIGGGLGFYAIFCYCSRIETWKNNRNEGLSETVKIPCIQCN